MAAPVAAITLTLDSTFIRGCEAGQRHLEVRLGNVETSDGARQIFASVARTDTPIGSPTSCSRSAALSSTANSAPASASSSTL